MGAPRIGLVGCGRWGRHVLRDLLGLGACVEVADPDPEARTRALEQGAQQAFAEASALSPLDGYVVASPASTHAAVLEPLLESRRPVFVEKPFTLNAADADRLADLGDGRLFVMDKWRYHPGVEAMAQIGRSGELGPALGCRSLRQGGELPQRDVDAIWTLAPHELSLALELLGHVPEARAACAEPGGSGLVALLGERPWQAFEVCAVHVTYRREVRLVCAAGVGLLADPHANHVLVKREGGDWERRPIPAEPPLRRELAAFLHHLRGGPAPRTSAREAAVVVRRLVELRTLAGLPA